MFLSPKGLRKTRGVVANHDYPSTGAVFTPIDAMQEDLLTPVVVVEAFGNESDD
jgi:hypothetical protein